MQYMFSLVHVRRIRTSTNVPLKRSNFPLEIKESKFDLFHSVDSSSDKIVKKWIVFPQLSVVTLCFLVHMNIFVEQILTLSFLKRRHLETKI